MLRDIILSVLDVIVKEYICKKPSFFSGQSYILN